MAFLVGLIRTRMYSVHRSKLTNRIFSTKTIQPWRKFYLRAVLLWLFFVHWTNIFIESFARRIYGDQFTNHKTLASRINQYNTHWTEHRYQPQSYSCRNIHHLLFIFNRHFHRCVSLFSYFTFVSFPCSILYWFFLSVTFIVKSTYSPLLLYMHNFLTSKISRSCSSEGDEDEEPAIKALRERERRQANNARERYKIFTQCLGSYLIVTEKNV